MPSRSRRRNLRNPDMREEQMGKLFDKPSIRQIEIIQGELKSVLTNLDAKTISRINAINYVDQNIPALINFLDYYYQYFYKIIDMISKSADITVIIASANFLSKFSSTEIANLNYIPGTDGFMVELEKCEELLLDILQDVIDGVDAPIITQRLNFMKTIIAKISNRHID